MSIPSSSAAPPPPGPRPTAGGPLPATDQPSLGEAFSYVAEDLSILMRQEVELAKAEIRQSATRAGKGAGMLAGAGFGGYMVALFVSVAAWWGIGDSTGYGWSALIVAAIWLVIAAILGLLGRRELTAVSGAPRTVQTAKKIPDALRGNESRP